MNILFVNNLTAYPPLGIMYLSSILKQRGYSTSLVNLEYEAIRNKLAEQRFDIVAFSVSTALYMKSLEISQRIKKEFGIYIIFGGIHPTISPEIIMSEGVDAVCIGEGDIALSDFIQKWEGDKDFRGVLNFWVKHNGILYKNSLRPLIRDLDSLSFPDRNLINISSYKAELQPVIATRGCPCECSFCFQPFYNQLYKDNGSIVRQRSVGNVIEELKYIKENTETKLIMFYDSTFNLNPLWVDEFCEQYIKENINIPFICQLRADMITRDNIKHLKKSGCRFVGIGIESGNEYIRNTVFSKKIGESQLSKAVKIIKESGLNFYTDNIIGLPWLPIEYDYQTLRLNIRYKPGFANVNFPQPYPKTGLANIFIKKGYLKNESLVDLFNKDVSFFNRKSIFDFQNLHEKRRIENLHHLFSIIVRFPILFHLTNFLVSLPFSRFYWFLFKLFVGHFEYRLISTKKLNFIVIVKGLITHIREY